MNRNVAPVLWWLWSKTQTEASDDKLLSTSPDLLESRFSEFVSLIKMNPTTALMTTVSWRSFRALKLSCRFASSEVQLWSSSDLLWWTSLSIHRGNRQSGERRHQSCPSRAAGAEGGWTLQDKHELSVWGCWVWVRTLRWWRRVHGLKRDVLLSDAKPRTVMLFWSWGVWYQEQQPRILQADALSCGSILIEKLHLMKSVGSMEIMWAELHVRCCVRWTFSECWFCFPCVCIVV